MTNEEILHKEIDLIQGVITRMANNSFLLKGWIVSLIAVLLALTKDTIFATQLSYFSVILLIPVFVFCSIYLLSFKKYEGFNNFKFN